MRFPGPGLACLALALGCTARSPPPAADESQPRIVIPAGAFVVLAGDTTVYREREEPVGARRLGTGERSYTVEVLAATDTRLAVRTLGPDHPPTCAGNFAFADDLELRFWVDRTDLRRVLVAPRTFEFTDGTRLELRPGVPVIDDARGELSVESQPLFVALEDARLGWAYVPAPAEFGRPTRSLRTGTPLHYGERSLLGAVAPFTRASDVLEMKDSTAGEKLLVFDNACGRFTLRAPADAVNSGLYAMRGPKDAIPRMARNFDPDTARRNAEILGIMSRTHSIVDSPYGGALGKNEEPQPFECTPPRWTIASGVALSWADGGPAGTVRRAHELPADARAVGDRVCFELDGLGLCAEARKLGRRNDPDCAATDTP